MYADTITLFNRHKAANGVLWYPTVLAGVDLNMDKAAIVAKYGEQATDTAKLHIKWQRSGNDVLVAGKKYLPPKEWRSQEESSLPVTLTFAAGNDFDFFILGKWESADPISDESYVDGLYNYMNTRFDHVFSITSVAQYSIIPHFEIMAK